jgi:hypothetical protein
MVVEVENFILLFLAGCDDDRSPLWAVLKMMFLLIDEVRDDDDDDVSMDSCLPGGAVLIHICVSPCHAGSGIAYPVVEHMIDMMLVLSNTLTRFDGSRK